MHIDFLLLVNISQLQLLVCIAIFALQHVVFHCCIIVLFYFLIIMIYKHHCLSSSNGHTSVEWKGSKFLTENRRNLSQDWPIQDKKAELVVKYARRQCINC